MEIWLNVLNQKIMYLYIFEILNEEKEIIIARSEDALWDAIPFDIETFNKLRLDYPDYKIFLIDERILREAGDRHAYLNPN